MKAAFITQSGTPDVIQFGDVPTPEPQPNQALVKVGAVSVNPIDTYIRNGANYWELPKPYIIGADMAGTVERVGANVKSLKPGDRVWCTNQGFKGQQGVFAEYCAVDEEWLYRTPDGVNVFWETTREPNFDNVVAVLAARGRMVLMAGREARPPFPVGPFYVKGCQLYGFAMFNATADELRVAGEEMSRWLAAGKLKPRIDRVLPLSQAAEAHRLQEENTLRKAGSIAGKLVLKP
jgi:NADPH:quinone reductase-like Zn-dependent oxidoreductase